MKGMFFWALVALNVVLALALAGRWHENAALAQPRMAVGSYLACPGEVVGGGAGGEVLYILDTRNLVLTAVQQTNKGLEVMPPVNLQREFGGK